MKKLFTALFSMALIVSMTVLASCGGAPSGNDVKKVVEKYQNNDELTKADYEVLLDYVEAAMDEAIPLAKEITKAYEDGDDSKIEKLQAKSEKLESKYGYMEEAINIIENASDEDLGDKGVKLASKLIEFM